jgi:DNA-directed RNA polymerase subunit K/omega
MSTIIKNSRPINKKKPTKDDSVFLSTTKTESTIKKVEFSKTEEDTEYDETEKEESEIEETEKEESEIDEVDDNVEAESEVSDKEVDEAEAVETEYKEEAATEEGEYKLVTGDQCLYNNLEDEIVIDDEIDVDEETNEEIVVAPENRITKDRLTIYERVRILGLRAKQISLGAKILIKNYGNRSPLEIAELELKHKVIPYKIKRPLANKQVEIWKLSELKC